MTDEKIGSDISPNLLTIICSFSSNEGIILKGCEYYCGTLWLSTSRLCDYILN